MGSSPSERVSMNPFSLRYPSEIHFGSGAAQKLPEWLNAIGSKRPLFCYSRAAVENPAGKKVLALLDTFFSLKLTDLPAEAPIPAVQSWIETAREFKADAVIALGGGAVIDAAKTAAALVPTDLDLREVFSGKTAVTRKGLPFAALPATAGTGSECTPNAVLIDPLTDEKKSIRHPSMLSDLAVIDPELTLSCPRDVTIHSGMDALVQAIESLCSRNASSVTVLHAREAVRLLMRYLPNAVKYPDNLSSRESVALGSLFSGMAFPLSGLGAVHGLAHPLGARLHLPHGQICAMLLLPVMRFNLAVCARQLSELADFCNIPQGAEGFIRAIEKINVELNIPARFEKITDSDLVFTVKHCRSNSMKSNPQNLSDDDVCKLLRVLC